MMSIRLIVYVMLPCPQVLERHIAEDEEAAKMAAASQADGSESAETIHPSLG